MTKYDTIFPLINQEWKSLQFFDKIDRKNLKNLEYNAQEIKINKDCFTISKLQRYLEEQIADLLLDIEINTNKRGEESIVVT